MVAGVEAMRLPVSARVRIRPDIVGPVRWQFGRACEIADVDNDGWTMATLRAQSEVVLAYLLAGFGGAVQIDEASPEIVEHLRRITAELMDLYA